MRKIKLEKGQSKFIKNAYGNNVYILNEDDKYYIVDEGNKGKAYSSILVDVIENKGKSAEIMIIGCANGSSDIYSIGKYGVELMSSLDQQKEFAKHIVQIVDTSSKFPNCELCDKEGRFHIYKDAKGRYFAVDVSRPILQESKYKKFDSYTELYVGAKLKGISIFDDLVNSREENPYLKQFVSKFKFLFSKYSEQTENLLSYKLIYPVLLEYLAEIKSKIGIEEYTNMSKPLNINIKQQNLLDLDELKYEILQQFPDIMGKSRGSADSEWDTRHKFFYNAKDEIEETIERIIHRLKEISIEYGDKSIIHKYTEDVLNCKSLNSEEFYNMMKLYPFSSVGKMIKDNPRECSQMAWSCYRLAKQIEDSPSEQNGKE